MIFTEVTPAQWRPVCLNRGQRPRLAGARENELGKSWARWAMDVLNICGPYKRGLAQPYSEKMS